MSLDTAAADHACNVIRRQIQEEFPDLTLVYIVHAPDQKARAVEAKQGELLAHPAGEAVIPILKKEAEKGRNGGVAALGRGREKKILPFLARERMLACFFVNAGEFQNADDVKRHALFLVWHALALAEDIRKDNKDAFEMSGPVARPSQDAPLLVWKNMLADAFSALMLELGGRTDSIGQLARERSLAALTPVPGAKPESYPFPLVLDATRLVYNDLGKSSALKGGPAARALEMTREIGETFDRGTARQWWSFCRTAQEMAWLKGKDKDILAAAVYSSEDPYIRATAYLVAEALNIQTLNPPSGAGRYNPFADLDVNERHHLKISEDTIRHALSAANSSTISLPFMKEALRSNHALLQGEPLGWCGHALLAAEAAFRGSDGSLEKTRSAFDRAMAETPWPVVQDLHRAIVRMRREGTALTSAMLAEHLKNHEKLAFLAPCFAMEVLV